MQNEQSNSENIINESSPTPPVLESEVKKSKNWLINIVVVFILIILIIIFRNSEFIAFSLVLSLPVVIVYLLSRNVYKGIPSSGIKKRSTFYSLILLLDIIIFIIIVSSFWPEQNGGLDYSPFFFMSFFIFIELFLSLLCIKFYEKYKEKNN